jgi:hypothetical protein
MQIYLKCLLYFPSISAQFPLKVALKRIRHKAHNQVTGVNSSVYFTLMDKDMWSNLLLQYQKLLSEMRPPQLVFALNDSSDYQSSSIWSGGVPLSVRDQAQTKISTQQSIENYNALSHFWDYGDFHSRLAATAVRGSQSLKKDFLSRSHTPSISVTKPSVSQQHIIQRPVQNNQKVYCRKPLSSPSGQNLSPRLRRVGCRKSSPSRSFSHLSKEHHKARKSTNEIDDAPSARRRKKPPSTGAIGIGARILLIGAMENIEETGCQFLQLGCSITHCFTIREGIQMLARDEYSSTCGLKRRESIVNTKYHFLMVNPLSNEEQGTKNAPDGVDYRQRQPVCEIDKNQSLRYYSNKLPSMRQTKVGHVHSNAISSEHQIATKDTSLDESMPLLMAYLGSSENFPVVVYGPGFSKVKYSNIFLRYTRCQLENLKILLCFWFW